MDFGFGENGLPTRHNIPSETQIVRVAGVGVSLQRGLPGQFGQLQDLSGDPMIQRRGRPDRPFRVGDRL